MRRVVLYFLMTGGAVGVFFAVQFFGERLEAGGALSRPTAISASPPGRLVHVLLALAVVIVLARLVGLAFRRIGQPPVIGEIAAGILLGPSLLGRIAPDVSAFVLPGEIAPFLRVIAELGVIIYMFLVGIDLDIAHLRARTRSSIAVSHASIVTPFVMGIVLALWLYPHWGQQHIGFGVFALFIGVSMSVTAFPVLARILTDRELHTTPLGAIALACAAVDDVTAWCLLALLVGAVHAEPGTVIITLIFVAIFIAVVLLVLRPAAQLLARRCEQNNGLGQGAFAAVCVTALLAAVATESIGIHALFGAFLVGVIIPHDSRLAREIHAKLSDAVLVLLLPAFFAFTGMRTQIGLLDSWREWTACGVIIAVAACGKLGGSALAARVTGLGWRHSMALGVLMNTRGLMELIVLNVGLDLGVLSPALFTMFVVMALVTTAATTPMLSWLLSAPDSFTSILSARSRRAS
jgi:Kef-type K+ transport system membrane component KefB